MTSFGTAGIRGGVSDVMTPEVAVAIGRAVGESASAEEIIVGRDGRETGRAIADAVTAGLTSAGVSVVRIGQVPTPALAFATVERHGVMVTASHNPPSDNGLKLFADGREYDQQQEQQIEESVSTGSTPVRWDKWGRVEHAEVRDRYRDAVAEFARDHGQSPSTLRVAVDCGNGMAGVATPQVLRMLGAKVVTLHGNIDGHFPGRGSKPTPTTLKDLRTFVRDGEFDVGIGHDGDADRIAIVAPTGEMVHEDTVVAILAEHYVSRSDCTDPVVVTTPNASARIDDRVRKSGGRIERVRLGALHEGIARVESDDGIVVFAAEPWKHIHPAFGGWIDGVLSAALLSRLIAGAGGLSSLRAPVEERPYRKENITCPDAAKERVMDRLIADLSDTFPESDLDTEYGVRMDFPDGSWVLIRPSGTEPYIRLYIESETVNDLLASVKETVESAVEAESTL